MRPETMKVGTLAKKAGLTVRTLHHYDEIGLLSPSERSQAGYRLYGTADIARLQQILSLRQLGFSLDAIKECLAEPSFSPLRIVQMHLAHLSKQIEHQRRLQHRLETLAASLQSSGEISVDQFIQTIEDITMLEEYYSKEQLDALGERAEVMGEEGLQQAQNQWSDLIAAVKAQMDAGADPSTEPVQALARQWMELVQAFTGGDAGVSQSLKNMYDQEGPEKASRGMVDGEVWAYINKAMESLK